VLLMSSLFDVASLESNARFMICAFKFIQHFHSSLFAALQHDAGLEMITVSDSRQLQCEHRPEQPLMRLQVEPEHGTHGYQVPCAAKSISLSSGFCFLARIQNQFGRVCSV
jgi:hypothetical protein